MTDDTELRDLEKYLISKIDAVVADVLQLVDDPIDRSAIVTCAAAVIFRSAVKFIRLSYEGHTGGEAEPKQVAALLGRHCIADAMTQHPRETRASKPRKPAARSS